MASSGLKVISRNLFRINAAHSRAFCDQVNGKKLGSDFSSVQEFREEFSAIEESRKHDFETGIAKPKKREKSVDFFRPKIDPQETSVILFPGQGSQYIGMGEALLDSPNVPDLFNIAKHVLGYDLLNICLSGPEDKLNQTKYSQPAVFVTSLAAVEKLREIDSQRVANCVATAGFSVGEFAALVFGGVLSYEDALKLVKLRAEGMQYASEVVPSGMMTIIFGADAKISLACRAAEEWCVRQGVDAEYAVCKVSNYLFPHCKVIGGHEKALKFLEMNAKEFGIRRCTRLKVSGAFHTPIMEPAQRVFKEALKQVKISKPLISIHSNIDGRAYKNETDVLKKLGKQMCSPVKWEQVLNFVYTRPKGTAFPMTFECGPGKTLLSILEKVNLEARKLGRAVSA